MSDRPWWHTCRLEEFKDEVDGFTLQDQTILVGEMQGLIARIAIELQAGNDDQDWKRRARTALARLQEKRAYLRGLIASTNERLRTEKQAVRSLLISNARHALEQGDLKGALATIIELLDGAHSRIVEEAASSSG